MTKNHRPYPEATAVLIGNTDQTSSSRGWTSTDFDDPRRSRETDWSTIQEDGVEEAAPILGDDIEILPPPSVVPVESARAVSITDAAEDVRNEKPLHEIRPLHISVHVYKPTPNYPVGIRMAVIEEKPTITDINPSGQFALAPIQVGDVVESINGVTCSGKTARYACDLIRDSQRDVILVVRTFEGDPSMVSSTVTKLERDSPIGISMKRHRDSVKISNLDPDGPLANSLLNIGDRIIRINDTDVGSSTANATATIRESADAVTIVARRDEDAALVVWSTGEDLGDNQVSSEVAGCCRIL